MDGWMDGYVVVCVEERNGRLLSKYMNMRFVLKEKNAMKIYEHDMISAALLLMNGWMDRCMYVLLLVVLKKKNTIKLCIN